MFLDWYNRGVNSCVQSFGLILYNMSLWTFLYQRSMDLCCFFCPKIKLGGENGRGGCTDNYYFSKRQECTLTPYSCRSYYSRNPAGNGLLPASLLRRGEGPDSGITHICVPRENSGTSRRLNANQMKRKRRLLNYV